MSKSSSVVFVFGLFSDTDCPALGTPIGGIKNGKSYNFRDIVTFSCGADFMLEGSETRVCLKNGMWSGTETYCRRKSDQLDWA